MKERPIIFSGPMVQATLDDRKTQTRRVVKPQPEPAWLLGYQIQDEPGFAVRVGPDFPDTPDDDVRCPYGVPGDRLWVRETWGVFSRIAGGKKSDFPGTWLTVEYKATEDANCERHVQVPRDLWTHWRDVARWQKYQSPRFMPRWASRIDLEIVAVRVERVQDISEEDARAEGISVLPLQDADDASAWWQSTPGVHQARTPRASFRLLWDSPNAKRAPWDANPWVWVIEFRRIVACGS